MSRDSGNHNDGRKVAAKGPGSRKSVAHSDGKQRRRGPRERRRGENRWKERKLVLVELMGRQEARGSTGAHSTIIILIEINFKYPQITARFLGRRLGGPLFSLVFFFFFLQDRNDSSGGGV